MNGRLGRRIVLWLCVVAIVLCGMPAYAAKQWAETGKGAVTADASGFRQAEINTSGVLKGYGPGTQYVVDVDAANTSYALQVQPVSTDAWYHVTVHNNGVSASGLNTNGGVSLYLGSGQDSWLIDNLLLPEGETAFKVKLEAGKEFYMVFLAFNNTTGTVSFEISPETDETGESMDAAAEYAAGEMRRASIAVPGDQDWYRIPLRSGYGRLAFCVENHVDETLLAELYDEFGECLAWLECDRNQTVLLNYDYQPGVAYYVRIVGAEGTAYGAYTCGWCDGIHHCLTEEERILEASCIAEGGSGRVCTICSAILGGKITPKTDHKYGQWRETVEPTKEAEGVEIRVCTFCGDVEMRSIPQKTSLFDRWFR